MGLQDITGLIGRYGKEVNRAFGAANTLVCLPLMIAAFVGLLRRKRWSLLVLAMIAGLSIYWSITKAFIYLFAPSTPGYAYVPGPGAWAPLATTVPAEWRKVSRSAWTRSSASEIRLTTVPSRPCP